MVFRKDQMVVRSFRAFSTSSRTRYWVLRIWLAYKTRDVTWELMGAHWRSGRYSRMSLSNRPKRLCRKICPYCMRARSRSSVIVSWKAVRNVLRVELSPRFPSSSLRSARRSPHSQKRVSPAKSIESVGLGSASVAMEVLCGCGGMFSFSELWGVVWFGVLVDRASLELAKVSAISSVPICGSGNRGVVTEAGRREGRPLSNRRPRPGGPAIPGGREWWAK